MGYIKHHAIVVTGWEREHLENAAQKAAELEMTVIGPGAEVVNGYSTMLVCPDGSKEGWEESAAGDLRRARFMDWLRLQDCFEWAEVAYGSDDENATVEHHAWQKGDNDEM
jgi:hypothetical protein